MIANRNIEEDVAFSVTFGVEAGYSTIPVASMADGPMLAQARVRNAWDAAMLEEFVEHAVMISAVIHPGVVEYILGTSGSDPVRVSTEACATVQGCSRIGYGHHDIGSYRDSVLRVADRVRKILRQRTAHVAFVRTHETAYLRDEEPET